MPLFLKKGMAFSKRWKNKKKKTFRLSNVRPKHTVIYPKKTIMLFLLLFFREIMLSKAMDLNISQERSSKNPFSSHKDHIPLQYHASFHRSRIAIF